MFPASKVTEIYCMADDFCKEFTLQQENYMIVDKKTKHRNKPNRMSDADIFELVKNNMRNSLMSVATKSCSENVL